MSRVREGRPLRVATADFDVAVIGGGFAGTSVTAQLARLADAPPRIVMFDRVGAFGRGAAYADVSDRCLLNVRAEAMGAFPDAEGDFEHWLRARRLSIGEIGEVGEIGEQFVPRRLYGEYLCALLDDCASRTSVVERREADVVDIAAAESGYVLRTAAGEHVFAHAVVLAIGNLPPGAAVDGGPAAELRRHARNPWNYLTDAAAGRQLERDHDVLIVGTGLTALDVLIALHDNGHRGAITALSRHGRLPLGHAPSGPCSGVAIAPLGGSPRDVLHTVRRLVAEAAADGCHWQEIIDGLRPQANRVWQSWTPREQSQFERHLESIWTAHRHRAPDVSLAVRDALIAAGRLRIVRAKLRSVRSTPGAPQLDVSYIERGADAETTMQADVIFDCSGPPRDLKRSADPLPGALFAAGLARPGGRDLGLAAGPDGLIHRTASAAGMYALGTPLRGSLFETGAVREIRVAARTVAEAIAKALGARRAAAASDVRAETA